MNRTAWTDGAIYFVIGVACLVEGHRLAVSADPALLEQALPPGAYIVMLGVLLVGVAVAHVIVHRSEAPLPSALTPELRFLLTMIAVLMAGYALAIYLFGYLIASVFFFFCAFLVFGVRSWLVAGVLTVVFVTVCYFVFVRLCGVAFPPGIILNIA